MEYEESTTRKYCIICNYFCLSIEIKFTNKFQKVKGNLHSISVLS